VVSLVQKAQEEAEPVQEKLADVHDPKKPAAANMAASGERHKSPELIIRGFAC